LSFRGEHLDRSDYKEAKDRRKAQEEKDSRHAPG